MRKWLVGFVSMVALAVILAGCGGGASGESKEDIPQEITVNATTEPPTLDAAKASDTTSGWVLTHIYEGLYTADKDGQPELGVAEDVEISEDGKTYTFTIREDAKWSDGSQLTAEDFEYAWMRALDPETGSTNAFYMYYIKGAEEYNQDKGSEEDVAIEALDDRTLEVVLDAPSGYFDKLLMHRTFYPVKKELVEEGDGWAGEAEGYISNGPFEVTEWKHDSELVVEKNDEYYDNDVVNLDKITFAMVNDATTYYQMYVSGELDLIYDLPIDIIKTVKDDEEYQEVDYYSTYMYMFNVNREPFTNEKVRRAFSMAVNRDELTENVSMAGEEPAYSMVPFGVETPVGDFREVGGEYFSENAEEAKKLLEEGMEEEGWDTLPEVELLYNTDDNHKKIAEAIQEMIRKNLDVELKISNQEWKTFLDTTTQQNFQMARMGWIGAFLDPVINLDYYLGESPNNSTGWINEEYDALMAKAKIEQDEDVRYEILHDAEEILMTDMPFMPVYFDTNTYMTSDSFEDIAYFASEYPYLKWAKKTKE